MKVQETSANKFDLPQQCIDLSGLLPDGGEFLFQYNSWLPWTIITSIIVLYSVPTLYIYVNRNKTAFRTRSPKLIMLGFLFMMADCSLNTLLLTRTIN